MVRPWAQLLEGREEQAPEQLAELELAYAGIRFRQGRYEHAVRWAERAVAHAESAGARRSLAHSHYLRGTAAAVGLGDATAAADLRRALASRPSACVSTA